MPAARRAWPPSQLSSQVPARSPRAGRRGSSACPRGWRNQCRRRRGRGGSRHARRGRGCTPPLPAWRAHPCPARGGGGEDEARVLLGGRAPADGLLKGRRARVAAGRGGVEDEAHAVLSGRAAGRSGGGEREVVGSPVAVGLLLVLAFRTVPSSRLPLATSAVPRCLRM